MKKVIILCFSGLKKKMCCRREILLISRVPKDSHSCYEFSHIKFCFFPPYVELCTFISCTLSLTVANFYTHTLILKNHQNSQQLKQGEVPGLHTGQQTSMFGFHKLFKVFTISVKELINHIRHRNIQWRTETIWRTRNKWVGADREAASLAAEEFFSCHGKTNSLEIGRRKGIVRGRTVC